MPELQGKFVFGDIVDGFNVNIDNFREKFEEATPEGEELARWLRLAEQETHHGLSAARTTRLIGKRMSGGRAAQTTGTRCGGVVPELTSALERMGGSADGLHR